MLVALTQSLPVAFAQSDLGSKGGSYNAPPPGAAPMSMGAGGGTATPPGYQVSQPNPTNCGTPDDPKPCGPMPRHALKSYPKHRSHGDTSGG